MRAVAWAGAGLFGVALSYFAWAFVFVWGRPVPATADFPIGQLLVNVALFTLFALHHSILARTPVKRWLTRVVPRPLERSLYVWVASLLFIATCALWQRLPGVVWQAEGAARVMLVTVQAAGVALTLRSASRLDVLDLAGIRQVEQARHPAGPVRSPGATAPAATTTDAPLEVRGPYRWIRHPIYLGWVLMVWCAPAMTTTRLVWAAVSTAYLAVAIPLEERGLVAEFGEAYETYRRRVRWRVIPGVW